MKIRKFKNTDAKEACNIIRRCDKEIASKDYPKKVIEMWDKKLTEDYILRKSKERICFVATIKEKVVGYISFDGIEIKKLHVNPDYHKQGIGGKLIGKIEDHCKKNKIKKILVKSSIHAEKFYEKLGFQKIKTKNQTPKKAKFKLIEMEKEVKR